MIMKTKIINTKAKEIVNKYKNALTNIKVLICLEELKNLVDTKNKNIKELIKKEIEKEEKKKK